MYIFKIKFSKLIFSKKIFLKIFESGCLRENCGSEIFKKKNFAEKITRRSEPGLGGNTNAALRPELGRLKFM